MEIQEVLDVNEGEPAIAIEEVVATRDRGESGRSHVAAFYVQPSL
jgi:hypothetical protein